MKKKLLKALSLVMAAVALVAITIAGTAAYFTSSSAVSNTFTVGNVGIQMFESEVDESGKIKANSLVGGFKTSDGNSYHLQPGVTYDKDPTIYVNAGSDTSYLFVKIRNNIEPIESATDIATGITHGTIKEQLAANGWAYYASTATGDVYVFAGTLSTTSNTYNFITNNKVTTPVTKDSPTFVGGTARTQAIDLFSKFSVDKDVADSQIGLYGGAKLTLTAFSIQTSGFVTDSTGTALDKAWNAIVATYPYEDGTPIDSGSGS